MNQIFCFVSVYLYGKFSKDSNDEVINVLFALVGGLFVLSMLSFVGFLSLINKEYLRTFFDCRTAGQFVLANYNKAETDAMKFDIFTHHRSFYDPIQSELKTWLNENWERWEDEKPDFFTPAAISDIPSDLLPPWQLRAMVSVYLFYLILHVYR